MEFQIMRRLMAKSTQKAASVKVLMMITLIYLPVTVGSVSISNQPDHLECLLNTSTSSQHNSQAKSNMVRGAVNSLSNRTRLGIRCNRFAINNRHGGNTVVLDKCSSTSSASLSR